MTTADIIIKNGAVFTGLKEQPEALTIAIKDDKIFKTGSEADLTSMIGDDTMIIDAAGNTVMTDFHDAHMHLIRGVPLDDYFVAVSDANSLAAVQKIVRGK